MGKSVQIACLLAFAAAICAAAYGAEGGSGLKQEPPADPEPHSFSDKMTVQKKYLVIPIRSGAGKCSLQFEAAGKKVLRCSAELAPDANSVDFWSYFTIEAYKGQTAIISAEGATKEGYRDGSGRWQSLTAAEVDISGANHNERGSWGTVRPALFASGAGQARFSHSLIARYADLVQHRRVLSLLPPRHSRVHD